MFGVLRTLTAVCFFCGLARSIQAQCPPRNGAHPGGERAARQILYADSADQVAVLEIAKACYTFTRVQKEVLATANLANSVESIIGMLPI